MAYRLPVASPVEGITAHLEKVIAQLKSDPAVAAGRLQPPPVGLGLAGLHFT